MRFRRSIGAPRSRAEDDQIAAAGVVAHGQVARHLQMGPRRGCGWSESRSAFIASRRAKSRWSARIACVRHRIRSPSPRRSSVRSRISPRGAHRRSDDDPRLDLRSPGHARAGAAVARVRSSASRRRARTRAVHAGAADVRAGQRDPRDAAVPRAEDLSRPQLAHAVRGLARPRRERLGAGAGDPHHRLGARQDLSRVARHHLDEDIAISSGLRRSRGPVGLPALRISMTSPVTRSCSPAPS